MVGHVMGWVDDVDSLAQAVRQAARLLAALKLAGAGQPELCFARCAELSLV